MIVRICSGMMLLCLVGALVGREDNLVQDFSKLARQAHSAPAAYWERVMIAERPVLLRVVANNCPLCRATDTMYSGLARHYADALLCLDMNYHHYQALLKSYNIRSLPTFLMFDKGVLTYRYHPVKSQEDLLMQFIERHLAARRAALQDQN